MSMIIASSPDLEQVITQCLLYSTAIKYQICICQLCYSSRYVIAQSSEDGMVAIYEFRKQRHGRLFTLHKWSARVEQDCGPEREGIQK